MNPTLLPFAVTCTLLYLGLGLLPFAPDGISWGDALGLLHSRLPADGLPVLPLLLALPLGFFWQGAMWPHVASARPAAAVALFLVQCLLAVLLLLAQIYFPPRLAAPAGLLTPVLGFAAGMVLWWLLGPILSRRLPTLPTWLWPGLVLFSALSVLAPLDLSTPLNAASLTGGLSAYVSDIPQRIYLLIKSAILWVPVGFLYTLSGRGSALPRWGVALVAALLLEGLPLLREQPVREALELLFALPGLWVGAWLGVRSFPQPLSAAVPREQRAALEATEGHARTGSRRGIRRH